MRKKLAFKKTDPCNLHKRNNMETQKLIYGESVEQVFEQIGADFEAEPGMLGYDALIEQAGRKIVLVIDIDPGGGFESGFETTTITAPLKTTPIFRFAIHHEGILDEIGKFFGMQDVITGYPEFDKKVVLKTDNEERVKSLFDSAEVRSVFGSLLNFTFGITKHSTQDERKAPFLEFNIDRGIVDASELRSIYSAFFKVLTILDIDQEITPVPSEEQS